MTAAQGAGGAGGIFEIRDRSRGGVAGSLYCDAAVAPCAADLWRVSVTWRYRGTALSGVKLLLTSRLPITAAHARHTLHPGLLYDGNPTAEACHYLGEDFPEAASTLPAGFSVEDAERVCAGWAAPQRRAADAAASVRLQVDPESGRYEAVHQIPESAVFGRRLLLDSDERLTLEDGARYAKTLYLYAAARRRGAVYRPGYCGALSAAWRQLYPDSPTNPPHTLRADCDLRLRTMLDDRGLIQEIARGGRTYRVFYVGRWVYGDAPPGGGRFLPKEYFHRFVGFSWSGMAGLAAHAALDHGLRHDDGARCGSPSTRSTSSPSTAFRRSASSIPLTMRTTPGSSTPSAPTMTPAASTWAPWARGCTGICAAPSGSSGTGASRRGAGCRRCAAPSTGSWSCFPTPTYRGRIDGATGKPAARRIQLLYWERSRWTDRQTRAADIRFLKPSERGATNFIYLIWAYVRAARHFDEQRYLDYAVRLGELALQVMERFAVFAGSEMDFYNIDKRQGHALLAAHNDLYAATGDRRWLAAAEVAASWFGSWQYHYNVRTDGLEHLPLGRWDYRTVGGTTVDVKYSTNNLVYARGAAELMRLWRRTADPEWFERARALLHQGVQSSLTEEKRRWLNAHYQSEARVPAQHAFNPDTRFDAACLGGGTEDVLRLGPTAATGPPSTGRS